MPVTGRLIVHHDEAARIDAGPEEPQRRVEELFDLMALGELRGGLGRGESDLRRVCRDADGTGPCARVRVRRR